MNATETTENHTITITRRSRLGWGWRYWLPDDNDFPAEPDFTGTYRTVLSQISADAAYQLEKSGGTLLIEAWFVREGGEWRRIRTPRWLGDLNWDFDTEVEIE